MESYKIEREQAHTCDLVKAVFTPSSVISAAGLTGFRFGISDHRSEGAQLEAARKKAISYIVMAIFLAQLRVLGVGFGIAVLIGNTIGSGILRNPGIVFFVTFRKLDS